jgi:hypothetical protein
MSFIKQSSSLGLCRICQATVLHARLSRSVHLIQTLRVDAGTVENSAQTGLAVNLMEWIFNLLFLSLIFKIQRRDIFKLSKAVAFLFCRQKYLISSLERHFSSIKILFW